MRKTFLLVVFLAACGGASSQTSPLAGTWDSASGTGNGTGFFTMTLAVKDSTITGSGVESLSGGGAVGFNVWGSIAPYPCSMTFQYTNGTSEYWALCTQSDSNHLALSGSRDLDFFRESP